jgi:hypothetical protein
MYRPVVLSSCCNVIPVQCHGPALGVVCYLGMSQAMKHTPWHKQDQEFHIPGLTCGEEQLLR